MRLLPHDLGVQRAVYDDGLSDLFRFFGIQKITSARGEFPLRLVVRLVEHDDRLFRSADHAVIESFGMDDRIDGEHDVRAVVYNGGRVARAHAESGFTARIRGLDHAGAARGENGIRFLHEKIGQFRATGTSIQPINPLGSARRHGRFTHDARRLDGALFRPRVRADDDAVAAF